MVRRGGALWCPGGLGVRKVERSNERVWETQTCRRGVWGGLVCGRGKLY